MYYFADLCNTFASLYTAPVLLETTTRYSEDSGCWILLLTSTSPYFAVYHPCRESFYGETFRPLQQTMLNLLTRDLVDVNNAQ